MKHSLLTVGVAILLSSCSSAKAPSLEDCRASIKALQDRVDAIRYVAQADPANVLVVGRAGGATAVAIAEADELLGGSCNRHAKSLPRVQ